MRGPLINAPELRESLGSVTLFDVRWSLADPDGGRDAYLAGHIPTALFVDLERDLCGDGAGRHPLPTPAEFGSTLGRLGLEGRTDVVVYDDASGSVAARMWWMLSAIGHRGSVRILDGGWPSWTDAGFDVATDDVTPASTAYPTPLGFQSVVDRAEVEAMSRGDHRPGPVPLLLDGRTPERYRGEHEPVDPKAGHIPGALNLPWQQNIDSDGRFLAPGTLRRTYVALGAERRPTIVSCGSGVTSCHLALAMSIAGLPRPRLYVGSFSDWASADLPVIEGPDSG